MLRVTLERSKTETRLNLNAEPPKQTLLALSKQEAPPSLDPWGMPLETSAPTPQPPSQNDPWGSGTLLGSNSPASKPTNYTVINTTAPMTPSIANTLTESRQTPPVRPLSPAASSSMGGEDLLIPWDDPTPAGPSLSPILQPHIPNNKSVIYFSFAVSVYVFRFINKVNNRIRYKCNVNCYKYVTLIIVR